MYCGVGVPMSRAGSGWEIPAFAGMTWGTGMTWVGGSDRERARECGGGMYDG